MIINCLEKKQEPELSLWDSLINSKSFRLFYSEKTLHELEAGIKRPKLNLQEQENINKSIITLKEQCHMLGSHAGHLPLNKIDRHCSNLKTRFGDISDTILHEELLKKIKSPNNQGDRDIVIDCVQEDVNFLITRNGKDYIRMQEMAEDNKLSILVLENSNLQDIFKHFPTHLGKHVFNAQLI